MLWKVKKEKNIINVIINYQGQVKCFSFNFVTVYDFFCIFARVKPKYRYEQDF